jgi:hypothetical protein
MWISARIKCKHELFSTCMQADITRSVFIGAACLQQHSQGVVSVNSRRSEYTICLDNARLSLCFCTWHSAALRSTLFVASTPLIPCPTQRQAFLCRGQSPSWHALPQYQTWRHLEHLWSSLPIVLQPAHRVPHFFFIPSTIFLDRRPQATTTAND